MRFRLGENARKTFEGLQEGGDDDGVQRHGETSAKAAREAGRSL
jgi:hypothetical protein